jgi:hypothetical protein
LRSAQSLDRFGMRNRSLRGALLGSALVAAAFAVLI